MLRHLRFHPSVLDLSYARACAVPIFLLQKESLQKAEELRSISEKLSQLDLDYDQERLYQQSLYGEYRRVRDVAIRTLSILRKVWSLSRQLQTMLPFLRLQLV